MLLVSSPSIAQVDPGAGVSPGELEQQLQQQNEQIVQFYTDAINWAIEASDRYWAYFAGIALVMILFKK